MKEKLNFLQRHLSATILVVIFVAYEIFHLISEGFLLDSQFVLLTTIIPFILLGIILDFLLSRNTTLGKGYKILSQLFPASIFVLLVLSSIFTVLGKDQIKIFNYLIWLFISLPFFIASYHKQNHRLKLIYSLIGTGLYAVIYMYMTTKTKELNGANEAITYFVSYFFILYSACNIKKVPYLGTILGALNAVILYLLKTNPITADAQIYGWDSDIAMKIEFMLLITLLISILIQFISVFQKSKDQETPMLLEQE